MKRNAKVFKRIAIGTSLSQENAEVYFEAALCFWPFRPNLTTPAIIAITAMATFIPPATDSVKRAFRNRGDSDPAATEAFAEARALLAAGTIMKCAFRTMRKARANLFVGFSSEIGYDNRV